MKKIIFILFTMLILSCCSNTSNNGYSYGTSSSQSMNKSSEGDIFERTVKSVAEKKGSRTMYLYDTKGTLVTACTVYKGQFDGHTWYVFDNCVVHDPLCNCIKK